VNAGDRGRVERPPADINFVDLRVDPDPELFHRLYSSVLGQSFTADELESEADVWDRLTTADLDPETLGLAALTASGDPVGTILVEWYRQSCVLLIGYLAVHADYRNQRLGSLLMREAAERWYSMPGCLLVVCEVDDPRHFADPMADRRLEFYARAGGELLAAPFFQPRLRPDAKRVHHMMLVVFSAAPQIRHGGGVDADTVRRFIAQYFSVCEGEESLASDPGVAWLLGFYDVDVIPLMPLLSYHGAPDPEPPTAP
jgi:GNAT superfamily N-acetyltransferase